MSKRALEASVHAPDDSTLVADELQELGAENGILLPSDVLLGSLIPVTRPLEALMLAFTCKYLYAKIPRQACFPFKLRAPLNKNGWWSYLEEFTMFVTVPNFIHCAATEYGYSSIIDEFTSAKEAYYCEDGLGLLAVDCVCGFQKNIERRFRECRWAYEQRFFSESDEIDRWQWLGYLTARHPVGLNLREISDYLLTQIKADDMYDFKYGRLLGYLSVANVDAFKEELYTPDSAGCRWGTRQLARAVCNSRSLASMKIVLEHDMKTREFFLLECFREGSIDFIQDFIVNWHMVSSDPVEIDPGTFFIFVTQILSHPNILELIETVLKIVLLRPRDRNIHSRQEEFAKMLKAILVYNRKDVFEWFIEKRRYLDFGIFSD